MNETNPQESQKPLKLPNVKLNPNQELIMRAAEYKPGQRKYTIVLSIKNPPTAPKEEAKPPRE